MTIEQKLAYVKAFHMGMADCSSCPLRLGTTCPAKPWHEWTDSEIMLAYQLLIKSHDEIETTDDEVEFVKVSHEEYEAEERERKHDSVHHPAHYCKGGIECIEAIKASMTADGFLDDCKGNVLKYIWRWRDKGGVQDLAKARVYLSWMIEEAEKCTEN